MFKNYLRIARRTLLKSKVFSFVNIFGLAAGMAAFLFIIHYVRFEKSYEDFHANGDDIYRITVNFYKGSERVVTDCETHAGMGPLLKDKLPEVQDYVRLFHNDGMADIKIGTQNFIEEGNIYFADQSAFSVFTLDALSGDTQKALTDPFQAVITSSIAKKYFGRTDVVGESIEVDKHVFHISAVIHDLPSNTHLKFSILLSHPTLLKIYGWYKEDDWNRNNEYTYLLMQPGTDLATFNKKLDEVCLSLKDKLTNTRYGAETFKSIHLFSNKTYEPEANGSARVVYFLLIIAVFIIVIAWVNYVNLSTARAVERAREVGIRKVMGSAKTQLVFQFLSESVIVNVLAGALALLLFQSALPLFRDLTGQPLPLNTLEDPEFWCILVGLLFAGSLLSGIYPAFVLSSFQPAAVLKGKFQSSSHGQRLRKGLVVFQFAATVVLIVCMLTVYQQLNYLRSYDLGMNIDQTLIVRAPRLDVSDSISRLNFQTLKNELLRDPNVQMVSRSTSLPGLSLHELSSTTTARVGQDNPGGNYTYYHFTIDSDFISTMNMKLATGRNFEAGVPNQDQVIINEEAVNRLGFTNAEEAIGSKIKFQTRWPGEPSTIIGVIKNFYQRSPKEAHIPMIFEYSEYADYFSLRLKTTNIHETISEVKTAWNKVYPNSVFNYFFLNQRYEQQYQADAQFGKVVATFSALAVVIACLGLFGLSSYTIVQRTKEIGIRKVLGASVGQIVRLLTRDFITVILIAALLALPASYLAMDEWLSNYAVRISLNAWVFVLPVVIILAIALITVSFQTIRTALANPTESLKQE